MCDPKKIHTVAWLEANHPKEDSSIFLPLAEKFPDAITPDALCLSDPSPDMVILSTNDTGVPVHLPSDCAGITPTRSDNA